jgi:hypothetical protein
MASGDFSLVHHGTYNLSGASIITAVGRVNIPFAAIASGAGIHIIGHGDGQASVLEVNVAP